MKKLTLLFLVVLLISCTKKLSPTTADSNTSKKLNASAVKTLFIANDNLSNQWRKNLEKIISSDLRFKLKKEPVRNRHVENVIDTIKRYTFKKSSLAFYKGSNFEFIFSAAIKNSEIVLETDIKTGMSKATFEKILGKKFESAVVKVGDVEQLNLFIFTFHKNRLISITFDGYID